MAAGLLANLVVDVLPPRVATAACGGSFSSVTVSLSNPTPGATSTYTIVATVPATTGCDLTAPPSPTQLEIILPSGTDATNTSSPTFNGTTFSFVTQTSTDLVFPVKSAVGTSQTATIVLPNVVNPPAGTYTLSIAAVGTSDGGSIVATTSSSYTVGAVTSTPPPTPSPTPTASSTPTPTPTDTPSPTATDTPTPTDSPTAASTPT
ncbi:MAG TPA: hypothetical protein VFC93_10245, partial [Chloroflexota bacterium]|nr:hypothetical protein [Chloroflexota bacterium]